MRIISLDHFVLTVACINTTCTFYCDVLGMEVVTFGRDRKALTFGSQKINLHTHHREFEPKAHRPTPGSADLCLLTDVPLEQVITHVTQNGQIIVEGPIERTGATGPLLSIYLRDPDQNLIEISNLLSPTGANKALGD